MMVFGVRLEMLGEGIDPLAQDCDLHFGGPCIGVVRPIPGDDRLLVRLVQSHPTDLLDLSFRKPRS